MCACACVPKRLENLTIRQDRNANVKKAQQSKATQRTRNIDGVRASVWQGQVSDPVQRQGAQKALQKGKCWHGPTQKSHGSLEDTENTSSCHDDGGSMCRRTSGCTIYFTLIAPSFSFPLPSIILCDEPTASLDKDSLAVIMGELQALARKGKAVAVVTHDPRLQLYADRAVEVKNGFVTEMPLAAKNDTQKSA